MKEPAYPLLHKGGYTNWVSLDVIETAQTVIVGPASLPVKRLSICCGIILAGTVGMAALNRHLEKQGSPDRSAAIVGFGIVLAICVWLLVWFQFHREARRGAVFIADQRTGKFQCPRADTAGDLDQLKEVVLVEGKMPFEEGLVMELQLSVNREGQKPGHLLIAHCLGSGLLDEMHRKLAGALRLPATKATG